MTIVEFVLFFIFTFGLLYLSLFFYDKKQSRKKLNEEEQIKELIKSNDINKIYNFIINMNKEEIKKFEKEIKILQLIINNDNSIDKTKKKILNDFLKKQKSN